MSTWPITTARLHSCSLLFFMDLTESLGDALSGWRRRKEFEGIEAFCLFVGYPRSGHTVIGALLNAHPDIVIAHELDALKFASKGYSRNQLSAAILDRDRWWEGRSWEWEGWHYLVEGQWQGRYRELKVVGDKAGGLTSRKITRDPTVLDTLAGAVEVPVKLIHHVRNPFDTISTMARKGQPGVDTIDVAIERYFREHVPGVETAKEWAGDDLLDVGHEAFVATPGSEIARLCGHLGQEASEDYLQACTDLVHPSPRKSRSRIEWREDQIDRVHSLLTAVPWLASYSYGD